jgi:hypothetical protein
LFAKNSSKNILRQRIQATTLRVREMIATLIENEQISFAEAGKFEEFEEFNKKYGKFLKTTDVFDVDKIFNDVMQEKAVKEILTRNLERIVEELKKINSHNSNDLIKKEAVEKVQREIMEYIDGLDESIKINVAKGREEVGIENREVEIEMETETEVQQELVLEQELEQLKRAFSSDGVLTARAQEVLPPPNGRETPVAWARQALGKNKE